MPLTEDDENQLNGEVMWVDHFGNCQTNISPEELNNIGKDIGDVISIKLKDNEIKMTWVNNFQENGINQVGIIVDSWGMISIFAKNNNAAEILQIKDGEKINIRK